MCFAAAIPIAIALGSSLMQAQNQKAAGAAAAAQAEQDAIYKENAALDAEKRGDLAADRQRRDTAGLIGAQRTAYAGNGIDVNSGSAANVQDDTAMLGELDALTISNNAAREAWGYRVGASNDIANAANTRKSTKSAVTGTILGGLASAAGSAYSGGMFSGGGGVNMQGQSSALLSNPAYVRNM